MLFKNYYLGECFTKPPGEPINTPENKLVDMYCRRTQEEVKTIIVTLFKIPHGNL